MSSVCMYVCMYLGTSVFGLGSIDFGFGGLDFGLRFTVCWWWW